MSSNLLVDWLPSMPAPQAPQRRRFESSQEVSKLSINQSAAIETCKHLCPACQAETSKRPSFTVSTH